MKTKGRCVEIGGPVFPEGDAGSLSFWALARGRTRETHLEGPRWRCVYILEATALFLFRWRTSNPSGVIFDGFRGEPLQLLDADRMTPAE
jgi:hypothetical protein